MSYGNLAKKKKKTAILVISGIIIVAAIGTVAYLAWPKNKPVENQNPTNSNQQIQQLKTELNSLKSKLDNVSDATQKSRLENKLSNVENQLKTLSGQNNSPATIEKLEQEIKKIKQAIEGKDKPNQDNPDRNDDPDENPEPTDKKEDKFVFYGDSLEKSGYSKFGGEGDNFYLFYISKNHPRIKALLSEGKLQQDKQFTIRYGKADSISEKGSIFTFNENNQELEIIEIKTPSPIPNPNPQPNPDPNQNELTKYIVTKINDNTYKYRFTVNNDKQSCQGFDDVSYSDFITLLKHTPHPQHQEFFKAFQGALKDANSKFPAYFWKCPPVSKKTLDKPFEFVVIKSETLNNGKQDWTSFGEHISKNYQNWACSFPSKNSGNTLIIPIPKPGPELDFKNISRFTKNAPEEQQQALWKEVAEKLLKELEENPDTPRWLNTEGTGVPYLHVRLDKRGGFYSNYKEWEKYEE